MSYYGTFKNFITGRFAVNKSERLHDMMLFLNDKNSFHLADIMRRYCISKSTALRDVASLERIGMPMYTEYGRNGAYRILQNRLLSPILFTLDEVFALYFSMCTTIIAAAFYARFYDPPSKGGCVPSATRKTT